MPSRLLIAYGLIAFLAIALVAVFVMVRRRRRAEFDLRWGNKKRWKNQATPFSDRPEDGE